MGVVEQHEAMHLNRPPPRELKIIDTASLLGLEERAPELSLNQHLDRACVLENAAPDGAHYLRVGALESRDYSPVVPSIRSRSRSAWPL